jgi:hypothetical protein
MPIPQRTIAWTRKHDLPGVPLIPSATVLYPQSLGDVIETCVKFRPGLVSAGSHWALSRAAVSDKTFVETHDPNGVVPALGRTLYEVVPACLTTAALQDLDRLSNLPGLPPDELPYYVHIETGKRIYQLYAELDRGDGSEPRSLAQRMRTSFNNSKFMGSWAFKTLGGAGGQTVFGALTTGTHGGDIDFPPVADSVRAIHLVVDGGRHYWIEPERPSWITPRPGAAFNAIFTDTAKLKALYDRPRFPSPDPGVFPDAGRFEVIREDNTFNAVLMSPGRFGIVYSIVLEAVPQYALHESRNLTDWQTIKNVIRDTSNPLYDRRFLQIAVNVAPHDNGRKNRCGITKRWNVALASPPPGRAERVGLPMPPPAPDPDPRLNATRFSMAGSSHPFDPEGSEGFMEKACSSANFTEAVIQIVHDEIKEFVDDHIVHAGGVIAATGALGGPGLAALLPALAIILALLALFLKALKNHADPRLGQVLDDLRKVLLDQPTPERRNAGVFVWRAIALRLFESMQNNRQYEAISYAVMDAHDYRDKSCNVNVDSVEVFFDATDSRLIAFVDQILRFEANQEFAGKAAVGYISLRFMTKTRALIGPERHPLTCAVEVAALKDVAGSGEMVEFATTLARDPNVNGILHWGQRNDCTMAEIQQRFGDRKSNPVGPLRTWRAVLSRLTENGRLDAFSTKFTRDVGLEIVMPIIKTFSATVSSAGTGRAIVAHYDCFQNPPATRLQLEIVSASGQRNTIQLVLFAGDRSFAVTERGNFNLTLRATIVLNGEARDATRSLAVNVV